MRNKPIVFVDMDQVLADFDKAACDAFGVSIKTVNAIRSDYSWDMLEPLSTAYGREITEREFWECISPTPEEGEEFWLSIEPLPWVNELVRIVEENSSEWYILSSPSSCHSAHSGKIQWLRKHIHGDFSDFILTKQKHLLSNPGRVLIDDKKETVDKFRKYGGDAILFPAVGNTCREYLLTNPLAPVEVYFDFINSL